ncbi:hypothetical protein PMI25_003206 [Pseudomonas sp. GM30]|nr:hypothetical protein PMI25_003206 [Pseudomonas sp. GM30]
MPETPPNPPITESVSPYESRNSRKLHEAAERALDHYLADAEREKSAPEREINRPVFFCTSCNRISNSTLEP